jgi:hypothetical protein
VLVVEALVFSFQLLRKFSVIFRTGTTVFWTVTPCRFVDEYTYLQELAANIVYFPQGYVEEMPLSNSRRLEILAV